MPRIIAGKHKGRVIPTRKKAEYRPSTGKLREAIFSILTSGEFVESSPLVGSTVLDLFSGTGSLGFEAISRGAAKVTMIDNVLSHLNDARSFANLIGESNNMSFLCVNALELPRAQYPYDLAFMDPPYHQNLAGKTLVSLIKGGWLVEGALIVAEVAKTDDPTLPWGVQLVKQKLYGNNKLIILRYTVHNHLNSKP